MRAVRMPTLIFIFSCRSMEDLLRCVSRWRPDAQVVRYRIFLVNVILGAQLAAGNVDKSRSLALIRRLVNPELWRVSRLIRNVPFIPSLTN